VLSKVIVPMSRVTVRSATATAARFVCTLYVTRRHLYLYTWVLKEATTFAERV
jgi:hypothetical protein